MSSSVCTTDDGNCKDGDQADWVDGSADAVIFVGAVCGQLSMGFLGDYLTRNQALSITLLIAALAAFLSAVAPNGSPSSIYSTIIAFRFVIGIGLGGIYPLSATKASEDSASSAKRTNSTGASWAFFWQIPGAATPWIFGYIFSWSSLATTYKWRFVLGLGAVPAVMGIACLLLEYHIHAKQQQEQQQQRTVSTSTDLSLRATTGENAKTITMGMIWEHLKDPHVRSQLIGSGGAWFLFDVIFYGISLIGGVIVKDIINTDDNVSTNVNVRAVSSKQALALSLGAVSIFAGIYCMRFMTLKRLQFYGFLSQAFCFVIFAGLFGYLRSNSVAGLYTVYCFVQISLQFGVALTSFSLPAALFEHDIRCTFNGIAAAMGKIGAIVGAYTFSAISLSSLEAVLITCVVVALVGSVVTHTFINETELQNDDSTQALALEMGNTGNITENEHNKAVKDVEATTFSPIR
eukprot:CAMPEP_0174994838 /NCGR_PEP_ID=MMETSP0004_2-20121128/23862_1 /TAXON_ID=420556 /ORGANISM="Ochromonas sp., Strain CCMP1393" /LENGTH=461 /DNA_ID=CAMNT_0016249127 /DNA_START=65 /DNA_END=1450 /DNA_ORIENTATION=-